MANNPAFPLYVNDLEGGTRHMTDEELGCYLRLLIAQFNRGGILPSDEKFLSRFCSSFKESWPIVKEKFKKVDGGLRNERLEKERVKKEIFVKKQSENGKNGGRPKKPKPSGTLNPDEIHKKPLGKGNGEGYGKGNDNGNGNSDGGSGEENYLVPQMVKFWSEKFTTYTGDKELDSEGMRKILFFITKNYKSGITSDPSFQSEVLAVLSMVANVIEGDNFWINKPIKSIANNIQEFFNRIKNPVNGKSNSKEKFTTTGAINKIASRNY